MENWKMYGRSVIQNNLLSCSRQFIEEVICKHLKILNFDAADLNNWHELIFSSSHSVNNDFLSKDINIWFGNL